MHKSGYIAIVGQPNVGKSTLLNALLGQKLAAVSEKPQMTREKILGIKTVAGAQMMFLDTPGIHRPRKSLNKTMVEAARESFRDADLILVLIEPEAAIGREDTEVLKMAKEHGKPAIVAINKIDTVDRRQLLPLIDRCLKEFGAAVVIPISAKLASGLDRLEAEILERLPEGPVYFPEDQIIREKIMDLTRQEVPYGTAVMVESFQEPQEGDRKKVTRIQAAIVVEKDSQKGILIGKGGQMIKQIGEKARKELETMLQTLIYLELFVKVDKDWTEDPRKVQEFTHQLE
jgi:GTP-binding protein Era